MLKIYEVLTKFDSEKDYRFDIRPQYGRCLSVMKMGDKFDSNQFVKDHRNEFTQRRNTVEANLAVIYKAITIGKRIGIIISTSASTYLLYSIKNIEKLLFVFRNLITAIM